jgi:hypothetical protein
MFFDWEIYDDAWQLGYDGKIVPNPFDIGSDSYYTWNKGWEDGIRDALGE